MYREARASCEYEYLRYEYLRTATATGDVWTRVFLECQPVMDAVKPSLSTLYTLV
jgi:hypothetical protein